MAAHRKLNRRRAGLCEDGLRIIVWLRPHVYPGHNKLSRILELFALKIQAQTDIVPKCVFAAVRDFNVVVGPGQTIEVKRGEQFLGKMYPNIARIRINGIWYEVSRNNVNLVSWHWPPGTE
jgi:hypothetical protein